MSHTHDIIGLPEFSKLMDGSVYRLGVALHDLQNPANIIGVGDSWILQPEDPWEITGYVHNVVFTCGAVPESDGTVKIYWGGADTVMCVGEANVSDLVVLCLHHGRRAKVSMALRRPIPLPEVRVARSSSFARIHPTQFELQNTSVRARSRVFAGSP